MLPHVPHPVDYAATRWSRAVVSVLGHYEDPYTIGLWGRAIGTSTGALRTLCRAAHVSAKDSLDFARLFRAVLIGQGCDDWDLANILHVHDTRTLLRLLERGGISVAVRRRSAPSPLAFLTDQNLVLVTANLRAISRELRLLATFEPAESAPTSAPISFHHLT
jgi:hypothetical protein